MKIEVYFDTICPWCWLGKRNLEKAIELWDGEQIEVTYKPFFLEPGIPEGGVPTEGRLQKKYGMTDQQLHDYLERLRLLGLDAGIEFNYEKIKITPNTIASHILINQVPEADRGKIIEKIFYEFFNQGKNIGNMDILQNIGSEFGVDLKKFGDALNDREKKEEVIREVYIARYRGIQVVPFYLINSKYSIQGAQKPELIIQGLKNVVFKENSIKLL